MRYDKTPSRESTTGFLNSNCFANALCLQFTNFLTQEENKIFCRIWRNNCFFNQHFKFKLFSVWANSFVLGAAGAGYTDILLTPKQYISKPHVHQEIERQHFSGAELLKRGTTMLCSGQKLLSPLLAKQTEENDIKNASQTTSVNSVKIYR